MQSRTAVRSQEMARAVRAQWFRAATSLAEAASLAEAVILSRHRSADAPRVSEVEGVPGLARLPRGQQRAATWHRGPQLRGGSVAAGDCHLRPRSKILLLCLLPLLLPLLVMLPKRT